MPSPRPVARRGAAAAALALLLAASLSVLAAPVQARSASHAARPACHRVAHPKRGAHACMQTRRHAQAHKRRGAAVPPAGAQPPGAVGAAAAPACENGSPAVRQRDGSLACADGSAPACEDGATPVLSAGGAVLSCTPPAEGEAGGCEYASSCATTELPDPGCEDGSAPVHAPGGSFSCQDGSTPACSDGSTPVRSPAGTALLCTVPAGTESA